MPLTPAARTIRKKVLSCKRCPLSAKTRPVAWSGPTPLRPPAIAVIGEAPGEEEEKAGKGFVGPSGQVLRRMMKEVGLEPERMAWLNICACRPPLNRDPKPEEMNACSPNVTMQLSVLRPRYILLVGRIALGRWRPEAKLAHAHGRPFVVGKTKDGWRLAYPIYHPAAIMHGKHSWDLEAKMRGDLREFAELVRVQPGERWPESCEICGRDVDTYMSNGVPYCFSHMPHAEVDQLVMFE